jgi:hypothetical protein
MRSRPGLFLALACLTAGGCSGDASTLIDPFPTDAFTLPDARHCRDTHDTDGDCRPDTALRRVRADRAAPVS